MPASNDFSNPNRAPDADRANRDPITGEPGSHPVGAGSGAAVGAALGGVAGIPGGPVGIAAGAAIGGIAGGVIGKSAAEVVNPTDEVLFWRSEFPNRPYAHSGTWEDFEPVYFNTATAYGLHFGREFAEVEPELERAWRSDRRNSRLEWPSVRDASRDAWERLAKSTKDTTTAAEREAAAAANGIVEMLHDGAKGLDQAAEAVKDPTYKSGLQRLARQRETFIAELKPLIAKRGEVPESNGSTLGALHRTWIGIKNAVTSSDHAILAECERGEDAALAKYRQVLESDDLTPALRGVLEAQRVQVQRAHDSVREWRDITAATGA